MHALGLFHYAALKNLAVRAPVARAVNVRGAGPVALRRRHALDAGPETPDDTTHALARQDAHVLDERAQGQNYKSWCRLRC